MYITWIKCTGKERDYVEKLWLINMRWEVGDQIVTVLFGVASKICSRYHVYF